MPRRDGTGPSGMGGGRMGGPFSAGLGGYCKCPNCGATKKHDRAQPCSAVKCPKCGTIMVRG
ncbi:hypothetical protein [Alkalibacter mobilis]|uniref:hypothetical protein n=1 Tax=Alkalibacter mobilis TaxID=2787712 RepID=UPI00189F487A|nr:hypothetical protein [Alkalibacter mobilis]MBF7096984.1 hypothetical protein [Alkalibacter mobilis]